MAKFPNIKSIAAAALCCIPCGWAAYAADGAQKPAARQTASASREAFEGKIYVSIQDPSMEWWFNVPAYAAPHISEIKKIFFNQEFSLFPFAENAKVRDGKFSISYSITMKTPDGTLRELVRDAKFSGTKIADNIIVACPDVIDFKFDKRYPDGLYKFSISAKDEISGETSTGENHLQLTQWAAPLPFSGKKLVRDYVSAYSLQPSPETLYAIFFSDDFSLEQKGAPNSLNYLHLGFLKAAFAKNRFLIPEIRDDFKNLPPINRAKFIMLLALLDAEKMDESALSDAEKKYQTTIRKFKFPDPYADWDAFLGGAQADMLWGEFFANGTYKPIRRIIDILSLAEQAAFADSLAAEKALPKNREDWDKYMLGKLYKATLKTLALNAHRYPLVEQYCVWAIERGDVPKVSFEVLSPLIEHISEMKTPEGAAAASAPKVKMPNLEIQ